MRRLELRPGFLMLLCGLYYFSPAAVFWPFVLLSLLHELGHLAALTLFDCRVRSVRLGLLGAAIQTEPLHPVPEAVCALAGPMVNLFCFWALYPWQRGAAMVSLLLGAYNLVPVYPLDGGRALRALLTSLLPLRVASFLEYAVMGLTLGAIGVGAIALSRSFGWQPLACYGLFLARVFLESRAGK